MGTCTTNMYNGVFYTRPEKILLKKCNTKIESHSRLECTRPSKKSKKYGTKTGNREKKKEINNKKLVALELEGR